MSSMSRVSNRWRTFRAGDPFAASPFRRAPHLAVVASIAILHVGLFAAGNWVIVRGPGALPAFPGYGLDLVILLAFGMRYWPILLAAYFGDSLARHVAWLPSCGVAAAALVRTLFGAWLIRRVSGLRKLLGPFEDLAGTGLAGIVATALGAALGAAALGSAGAVRGSDWTATFVRWWIADALGAFTAAPVLLVMARLWTDGRPSWKPWFGVQSALCMVCVAAAGYLIFFRSETRYLLFSAFLLILIAAAWLGPAAARFAALIISFAAIGATRAGLGAFAGGSLRENLQNLAFFLLAVSFTGIAVGAFRAIGNLALPAGVLLVGWALSGWLYASMDRGRASYDDARLDRMITGVENRTANGYRAYADLARDTAAFVAASSHIPPEGWNLYLSRLDLSKRYPGPAALSILQPAADAGLSGAAPGTADPSLREAAERSRDSGQAVLATTDATAAGTRPALQLFLPVYREGVALDGVAHRRSALRAWVTVTFDADSLFQTASAAVRGFVSLSVSGGPTGAWLSGFAQPGMLRKSDRTTRITLGGNTWTLRWTRREGFPYLSREPFALAAGCTALLSLFLAALVLALQTTRRRASDHLKLLQSALTLGTWEFDLDSGALHCSEQLSRLYGIAAHRERISVQEWLDRVHPDDRETVAAIATVCPASRAAIDRQYRVSWPDGSVHWLHSKAIVVSDERGVPNRVLGVDFDVSEIKQLQNQLAQAQKLQSVGQLAAGVAHEINTPIQYIGDNGKFLEDAFNDLIRLSDARRSFPASTGAPAGIPDGTYVVDDQGAWDYLRAEVPKATTQLLEGVDQVSRIVRAMKEFSHPGPVEKCAADINRAIENTVLVSKNEWKYVANLTTDLDRDLPPVPCVVGEIHQAILNLIVNASHAIGDVVGDSGRKGNIHIRTSRNDGMAEIRITDTGGGIPAAIQSKVFDPFFTTKPVGIGTGQGLAITHAVIVQKHHGTITFESDPGRGTTFVIRLPLARELDPVFAASPRIQ